MGIASCNRVMAFACVVGPIRSDGTDLLIGPIWPSKPGNIGASPMLLLVTSTARISSVCSSIPLSAKLRFTCRAVDVNFTPKAAFRAAMLARVPLAFPFSLDAGAIRQQVQRPLRAATRDDNRQGLLPPLVYVNIQRRAVVGTRC
jgi:hypothetical protein